VKNYVLKAPSAGRTTLAYDKDLNPQQLEVVQAGPGPLLVIAGAGSGKTRTLTYRVARLIEGGVSPASILLLTFTNKAAREMLHRVETLLPGIPGRVVGGTFHHVGNLVLRRMAELVGYKPNFTILDREDARDLMDDVVAHNAGLMEYKKFPKGDVILEVLSFSRNTDTSLERVITEKYPIFFEIKDYVLQACNRYGARKRDLNVMDFDDLLLFWREILRKHEEVREAQRRAWSHLLVDEFQDTNKVQSEIVDLIAGERGNLMVVGDDSQSIYSFRGANFGNIMDFPKRHAGARICKLETNYRSAPEILDLANSSIRHNPRQFQKTLQAVRPSGGRPEVVSAGDPNEQARYTVQRMFELRDEGCEFKDIAVLYRAHYHSMELQMELTRRGVPFQVRSGLRFFEQAHIKDVAAYLKVAANGKDELAWKRILRLVPRIGKTTAEKIWAMVEREAFGEVKGSIPKGAQKGWEELVVLVGRLRSLAKSPAEMIRAVLDGGYEAYLQTNFANFGARLDDVRRLADYALRYEDVDVLLSELALTAGISGEETLEESEDTDYVVLSTVHQAKGLEWRAVFVLWLVDGKFPDGRALREEGGEEEERRLFYVAATRAKDRLFLVHPVISDERFLRGVIQRPSRFIAELDRATYDSVTVTPETDFT
jgi:DNA helicase-2/ATP-dependent DNA helicase PcrA